MKTNQFTSTLRALKTDCKRITIQNRKVVLGALRNVLITYSGIDKQTVIISLIGIVEMSKN